MVMHGCCYVSRQGSVVLLYYHRHRNKRGMGAKTLPKFETQGLSPPKFVTQWTMHKPVQGAMYMLFCYCRTGVKESLYHKMYVFRSFHTLHCSS